MNKYILTAATIQSGFCGGCGEVIEDNACQCEGYAVVITDFLTDRTYTGICLGWRLQTAKCDDRMVWKDWVMRVSVDGCVMAFASQAMKVKQEE